MQPAKIVLQIVSLGLLRRMMTISRVQKVRIRLICNPLSKLFVMKCHGRKADELGCVLVHHLSGRTTSLTYSEEVEEGQVQPIHTRMILPVVAVVQPLLLILRLERQSILPIDANDGSSRAMDSGHSITTQAISGEARIAARVRVAPTLKKTISWTLLGS